MAGSRVQKKWLLYLLWMLLCVLVFWKPAYALFNLAEQDETASHILLIPFIAAWLVYTEQKQLRLQDSLELRAGSALFCSSTFVNYSGTAVRIVYARKKDCRVSFSP